MRFLINTLEVEHNGIYYPVRMLKKEISQSGRDISHHELGGLRKFNKTTGMVDRKYAWDAVICEMIDDGSLKPILANLLNER